MRAFALVAALLIAVSGHGAAPTIDPWCGTNERGELPDLWQQALLEVEALEQFHLADAWNQVPGRFSLLLNKLALVQRASVKQGPDTVTRVRSVMDSVSARRASLLGSAEKHDVTSFTQSVAEVRGLVDKLGRSYAAGVLQPGAAMVNPASLLPGEPTLLVKATAPKLVPNQTATVDLRLRDKTGAGIGSLQLLEAHTRRLHVMLIDPTFEDYHHEHPITSGRPGDFTFNFTPRKPGDYLLWLDATPMATGRNETPESVVTGATPVLPSIARVTQMSATADGWRFQLSLDRKKVIAGQPVNARLRVTDEKGVPCFTLEPFMGAFAHVVGFMDDRHTMLHVHSHGEPPHELTRSGPDVLFRLVAPKAGFIKLFIQVQINGTVSLAKFGFPVE